jgi:hypothetical protein
MVYLTSCTLQYREDKLWRQKPFDQATALNNLKDTVLFLDEVLPKKNSEATEQLRFLLNFGRALGMRVVLAGTAATAAIMIRVANPGGDILDASRLGEADIGWMEIYFLWSPVRPFASASQLERPLLAALLEGKTLNAMESADLIVLANTIAKTKKFTLENKLIWLSGPWLATTSELQVSPFN